MQTSALALRAARSRRRLMEIIYHAKAGHTGGDLSCLNVLTALYFHTLNVDPQRPDMPTRDRFILSKGHCVEALYATLEARGFLSPALTDTLGHYLSPLAGHPTVEVPGIEVNSGALGHGLSVGVGIALAAKMDGATHRTFVLMGDGEQGEGSIYEAAMSAHHYQLDNLVAIIDRNGLQISGRTEEVMALESIRARWEAFGWEVIEMDGDDMASVVGTFDGLDYTNRQPHLILSRTTKGRGVSFMEGVAKWHHGVPTAAEYALAMTELENEIQRLS